MITYFKGVNNMYISDATYEALNNFLTKNFQMNSFCDNIAYNLGYRKMASTEPLFHEKFAHAFPQLADTISDLMLRLEARPVRGNLNSNIIEYQSNVDMFTDLKREVDAYRLDIFRVIDVADINNDIEVKVEMENFSATFLPYVDQVNLWHKKALEYGDAVEKFDHDFPAFTKL